MLCFFLHIMTRLILAVVVLGLAACGAPSGSRQAPELILPDLAGKTVDLTSFRGKPVLVSFWATWCDTCKAEMPDVERLYRRSGGKYSVIGVSMDENASVIVPPFLKEYRVTFPILVANSKVANSYAVRGLPTAYLIDAEGRIARRWVGALDAVAAENDILALLNRRPE